MTREPDIEIRTDVRADSVRFGKKPDGVSVRFTGDTEQAWSGSERENLPDEVEPGVTYRDVRVRWSAVAKVDPRISEHLEEEEKS